VSDYIGRVEPPMIEKTCKQLVLYAEGHAGHAVLIGLPVPKQIKPVNAGCCHSETYD
jgi:hypothetical protein